MPESLPPCFLEDLSPSGASKHAGLSATPRIRRVTGFLEFQGRVYVLCDSLLLNPEVTRPP